MPSPAAVASPALGLPGSPSRPQVSWHCPWQKKPGLRSGNGRGAGGAAMMEH